MFNFDETIERRNTNCMKWDGMQPIYGSDDLLPLWVADMDFRPPQQVIDALREKVDHGIFGYTLISEQAKDSVVQWVQNRHDWSIKKDWLHFSSGVIPSIAHSIQALTAVGDQVLILSPVYTPFFNMIEINNRKVAISKLLNNDQHYEIDFEDFENQLKNGVKLFILCNPHNPGGRVWSTEELTKIVQLCKQYNVPIISDEIHADLVAAPYKHIPLATIDETYSEEIITLMAPSKTFNLAGLQAAFAVIKNETYREKIKAIYAQAGLSQLNTMGLVAMEAAYTYGESWLNALLEYVNKNFELVTSFIENELPKVKVMKPEGTYLIWLDCSELGFTSTQLKNKILKEAKIAVNFGEAYGPGGELFIRLNAACTKEVMQQGLIQLKQALA